MTTVIFLSAVSDEFHKPDPKDPQRFHSYRDILSRSLDRCGPDFKVIVQETLAQGTADLLHTLDQEVHHSSIFVHLIGYAAGFAPGPVSLRKLKQRHETSWFPDAPELVAALGDCSGISYTQWEFYLAYLHSCKRYAFVAGTGTPRAPAFSMTAMEDAQAKHIARLKIIDEHPEPFDNQLDLALKVVTSVVRNGLAPKAGQVEPSEQKVQAAREDAGGLVQAIAHGVRNPEKALLGPHDPAGVEVFLRALDTAALKHELDRRAALEIAHEHRAQAREAVEAEPTPENLRELALAELAVGDYPQAMAAAQREAETAVEKVTSDPSQADKHREDAQNAYLLLHEAAKAGNKREEAIAALKAGCVLIDKARDPVLWADYHEALADYYLDHAQFADAESLIDEITDVREEHQEDQPALANSLLTWARLLYEKADYSGCAGVAARAERIFSQQIPADVDGVVSSLNMRGSALHSLARLIEAEGIFRRGLSISEVQFGPDDSNVTTCLSNLGQLAKDMNRFEEAESLMRRALASDEQSFGPMHPRVATEINNLSALMQRVSRPAEAEPLMRRALAIDEQSFGSEHPKVAIRLNNLAQILLATNRPGDAEQLVRRALTILAISLGVEHPSTQTVGENYILMLKTIGRSEAEIAAAVRQALDGAPPKG